jgi:hypothetical protein
VERHVTLDSVVPWGRSFDEYCRMFALRSVDLAGKLLGCADGPASFNAELTARGGRVISADPLYALSAQEIRSRIADARDRVIANTQRNLSAYVWDLIPSLDALQTVRMNAMARFLLDFDAGKADERYRPIALPELPFEDRTFDLVLCSHFLFLYSSTLTLDFHVRSLCEMARVGGEVRVFPLLDIDGRPSPHLAPTCEALEAKGMGTRTVHVPYEFVRGANRMLVIRKQWTR